MASYTSNLNLKKPSGDEDASILDINGNMEIIDNAVASNTLILSVSSLSALPHVISNSKVSSAHQVVMSILSNPAAMSGDEWTYQTSNGSITISGTISGTTNLLMQLVKVY